jgi:hypothetical protein
MFGSLPGLCLFAAIKKCKTTKVLGQGGESLAFQFRATSLFSRDFEV